MSEESPKKTCGNCDHLQEHPDDGSLGCQCYDDNFDEWTEATEEDLTSSTCDNWTAKEDQQEEPTDEDTDVLDIAGNGSGTGTGDADESSDEHRAIAGAVESGEDGGEANGEVPGTLQEDFENPVANLDDGGTGEPESEHNAGTDPKSDDQTDGTATEPVSTADTETGVTDAEQPSDPETAANSQPVVADEDLANLPYDELLREARKLLRQNRKYSEHNVRLGKVERQIESAKEEKASISKEIKDLQDEMQVLVRQMNKIEYKPENHPLIEKTGSPDMTKEDVVSAIEAVVVEVLQEDGSWRDIPARDHFTFTEAEWELMAPSEGIAGKMTVGDLEEFRVRLSREKIKGFGDAKRQKLDDQMEKFWFDHPEFCGMKPTDDGKDEVEKTCSNCKHCPSDPAEIEGVDHSVYLCKNYLNPVSKKTAELQMTAEELTENDSACENWKLRKTEPVAVAVEKGVPIEDVENAMESDEGEKKPKAAKRGRKRTMPAGKKHDVADFLSEIEDMMKDDRYDFAADTLSGIHEWVSEHDHFTEAQRDSVDNIYSSVVN